jgi:hypothetical protein
MNNYTSAFARVASLALALSLLAAPLSLPAVDGTLTIVTSYPKDTTGTFKKAFEKKYPNVKVEMLKKKTTAGIKYLQETAGSNTSDMFWASAPDAFEVLKGDDLLAKYQVKVKGIPEKVGAFPINDPDGYYKGFAASGYGIMWNTRYLKAKKLPAPAEWVDLKKPVYHGHVGMSAPSRSGTTHLTVETLLQGEGWEKGWAEWKAMAGNFKTVTERSFGVPDGVNSGQFGVGIVIDFFGLSSKASGQPRGRRRVHRVPALHGRPGAVTGSEDPPFAGQPGDLRQGPCRLSEPIQGQLHRIGGEVRSRPFQGSLQCHQFLVRRDDHLSSRRSA